MADLSKIVCLEQDCRHGTEQTSGSGSGNDTYTKAEIDSKDADIRAAASEAKSVANNAKSVNQTQDGQIKALQRAVDNLHNYEHPAYSAHQLGFYKFANDEKGHITDAEEVTASDLYNAGGVIQSSLNLYDYIGYIPLSFMTLYYGGGLKDIAEIDFDRRDDNKRRVLRLCLGSREDRSTGCLRLMDYNGCQYDLRPNPDSPGAQMYGFYLPKQSGTLALTKDIPDISGKQDKSTAVTHTANTAVGSATKPVYVAANGTATPITHSINSDVPANAKFTDTTYSDATQSTHGLMTAADKKKLDEINLTRYLHYNAAGGMLKDTWYKFASFNCTQQYNYSSAIFVAGFRYNVMRVFRITAGTSQGKPVASRISLANITGDLIGLVGYIINGNTVNFFLKPATHMYGYVGRIGATAETGDFITQTDLVAATTAEAASIVPFTAAGTDVAFSNHSNETDKISNGTLRSGFYVNAAANSTSGYTWFRMATCKISGAYETVNTTFLITNGMAEHALLSCGIRNNGTGKAVESCLLWISARNHSMPPGMFRVVAINSDTGVTYELWGQISARWQGVRYTVLDERNISGGKYNNWKLESHSDADAKTAPTKGNYYANSSDISVCATAVKATEATTLTETAWTDVPETNISPRYGKNIKYLKSGNTVYVRGSISFSASLNNPCCGTMPSELLPDDYQDHVFTAWNLKGGVPTAYPVVLGTDGKIILMNPTSTANWFVAGRAYNFNFNYHIG